MAEQTAVQQTVVKTPVATAPTSAPVQEEKAKRAPAKKRVVKKIDKTIVVKSKRKTTVARAYVRSGKGSIRINGRDIRSTEFGAAVDIIMEPVTVSGLAKDWSKRVDIKINVYGGGVSSQIQAVRGSLAKALVAFSKSEALKQEYLNYDRSLLVDDQRRVEPKKFKGPKARARFQTSYR